MKSTELIVVPSDLRSKIVVCSLGILVDSILLFIVVISEVVLKLTVVGRVLPIKVVSSSLFEEIVD